MGKLCFYCIKLYTFFMEVNIFWTKVIHALGVAKRIIVRRWKNSIVPDVKDLIFEMCDLAIFEKKYIFCQSENVTLSFPLEKKIIGQAGWNLERCFIFWRFIKQVHLEYILITGFFVFGNVLVVLVPPFFFEQCLVNFYFFKYLFENELLYITNEIFFKKRIKKEIRNWKRRTLGLRKKSF